MTVLIVDDQDINLRLLRAVLEAESYSVVHAVDGVDALETLRKQPVNAIISDILMPRMDGYRFCSEVRRDARLCNIPFIFYTATYTSPADEKLCYDLGADLYLRKPATPVEIIAALRSALERATDAVRPTTSLALLSGVEEVVRQYSEQLVLKLEEKNAELAEAIEKLRANEDRMQALLRSMDDMLEGVQLIDPAWRYVYVNRAAARQGQTTVERLSGRTMMECYPGIEKSELFAALQAVMRERVARQMRNRFEFPDGSCAWFELSIEPDPHGIMIRSVDITERERSEATLRESEERFRQVVENIGRVFWMTDLDKQKIEYVSPGYEAIWGRSVEDLYRSPTDWIDAIHPEDRERIRAAALQQATGEYDVEYRIIRSDGGVRWIHDRAFPVRNEQGRVYRVTGVATDVTEKKDAEAALRNRAEELERFHRLSVGREQRMIELKREVNALCLEFGRTPPYASIQHPSAAQGDAQ